MYQISTMVINAPNTSALAYPKLNDFFGWRLPIQIANKLTHKLAKSDIIWAASVIMAKLPETYPP